MNIKPFYIHSATEREKEACLCKVCLNTQLKFDGLMKIINEGVEVTNSLTEYFGAGILCPKDVNGYFHQKCIAGECQNKDCSSTDPKYITNQFKLGKVDYNQFVVDKNTYIKQKRGK